MLGDPLVYHDPRVSSSDAHLAPLADVTHMAQEAFCRENRQDISAAAARQRGERDTFARTTSADRLP